MRRMESGRSQGGGLVHLRRSRWTAPGGCGRSRRGSLRAGKAHRDSKVGALVQECAQETAYPGGFLI
eukprot:77018-Pyramimonas_sp.AAC.1